MMIAKLLCALGFHDVARNDRWVPSIAAEIVTEFEQTHTCRRCRKLLGHLHLRWDGEEMREVA